MNRKIGIYSILISIIIHTMFTTLCYAQPPELVPYFNGEFWGFADHNKNIKIECKFGLADPFIDG